MEKTITFNQNEQMQSHQIEQERTQILAQVGALMMDLETSKKALDTINERRNTFIRAVLSSNGISSFESCRPTRDGVMVTVQELAANRPNGAENVVEKNG
jgi:2-polyprenyl-3-methyl-5-hydroxy-6-metoxy-1,4-benzoquinol methylase